MTIARTGDPADATQQDRYGEDIAAQHESDGFHQRLSLAISHLFQPIYTYLFAGRGHFISNLEARLAQAERSTPVEIYLSNVLALGTGIGILLGGVLGIVGLGALSDALFGLPGRFGIPASTRGAILVGVGVLVVFGLWIIVAALAGFLGGLATAVHYPSVAIYRRRREIDVMLPNVAGFMYSLSVGGMDTLDIFSAVADSEDTYGEIAVEFQRLTHEIEYFNTDYQTAVEHVAETTPSDDLSTFLIDLLSIINSGGDVTEFLETEKDHQTTQRRRTQESMLETLEVFGEMYISLTVLPLILIVILVIMALLGDAQVGALLLTVYLVLPALNVAYFLAVSITTQDAVGTGRIQPTADIVSAVRQEGSIVDVGIVDQHVRARPQEALLHRIRAAELHYRVSQLVANPLEVFRRAPRYTLVITVPSTVCLLGVLAIQGIAVPSREVMIEQSLGQSFVWFGLPLILLATPVAVFSEWRARTVGSVTETLTADLRKLANANATGQPLLEAIRITGADNNSRLGHEFTRMYKRVSFGSSLATTLVEFNNRYCIPRLARSVTLVQKAQETSDHITDVLKTAADLSEIADDIERERRARTQMQVAIIVISFFVFVAVLLMLEKFFIETIVEVLGENPDTEFADLGSVDPAFLSMLYLHAALIQGFCAGIISGYVQTGELYTGFKYAIGLVTVTFLSWGIVGMVL